jgi:hypothetical protein
MVETYLCRRGVDVGGLARVRKKFEVAQNSPGTVGGPAKQRADAVCAWLSAPSQPRIWDGHSPASPFNIVYEQQ